MRLPLGVALVLLRAVTLLGAVALLRAVGLARRGILLRVAAARLGRRGLFVSEVSCHLYQSLPRSGIVH